jgi:hypothetical protein
MRPRACLIEIETMLFVGGRSKKSRKYELMWHFVVAGLTTDEPRPALQLSEHARSFFGRVFEKYYLKDSKI